MPDRRTVLRFRCPGDNPGVRPDRDRHPGASTMIGADIVAPAVNQPLRTTPTDDTGEGVAASSLVAADQARWRTIADDNKISPQ